MSALSIFRRVCVVYLPSPYEHAWRQAIAGKALMAGWTVARGTDEVLAEYGTDLLVNCDDGDEVEAWAPTDVLVLNGNPGQAVQATMSSFGSSFDDALFFCAIRYARAGGVVDRYKAPVFDQALARIGTVFLDEIERADVSAAKSAAPTPLSFYETLPPPVGAAAIWPASMFTFCDPGTRGEMGGHAFDMTGRNRLLQYGPNFLLAPGTWRATLRFALTRLAGSVELRATWGNENGRTVRTFSLKETGVYEIELTKDWPVVAPVELQLCLERPLFDGAIEILECQVGRVAADASAEA